jgi:periplasmic protein CpxP/Spy
MTMRRLALRVAIGVFVFGIGAGTYTTAQSTNQDPRPQMGRGRGPGGLGRGGPMGMLPMFGRDLNLTDAQKDQVRTIAESHRDEWKALADRARTAHEALQQAVTADAVDEALIRQRSAAVAAVEADLAVARARTHAEVFRILTPEQKAEARDQLKRRPQRQL